MNILLDTHVLIWASSNPEKISPFARYLLEDSSNILYFSTASIWEISIKFSLNRPDFTVNPGEFSRALIENGFQELKIILPHVIAVSTLPPIHKDPFDRLIIAQAFIEEFTLLTNDLSVLLYPGDIHST